METYYYFTTYLSELFIYLIAKCSIISKIKLVFVIECLYLHNNPVVAGIVDS